MTNPFPACRSLAKARKCAVLLAPALLAGCASAGDYPSLARRPAELADPRAGANPPVDTAAARPLTAAQSAQLAELESAARSARGLFAQRRDSAQRLVAAARGAAPGSEAWAVASVALADLTSARSALMVPLGDLDRLYIAQRVDGGDGGAIAAVRDQVTAWVADEDAVLADLNGRLRG